MKLQSLHALTKVFQYQALDGTNSRVLPFGAQNGSTRLLFDATAPSLLRAAQRHSLKVYISVDIKISLLSNEQSGAACSLKMILNEHGSTRLLYGGCEMFSTFSSK